MADKTYYIATMGCPKNSVDSENMAALLQQDGYTQAETPEHADVLIVNTCCFIEPAKQESINAILEAAGIKKETGSFLIVSGCLPQRYKDEIANEIPEVDAWMGLEDISGIRDIIKKSHKNRSDIRQFYKKPPEKFQELPRIFSTPESYGYIKVAEGCSHNCFFCVIPKVRGRYRSITLETAKGEAEQLVKSGRKEIVLIAQDITLYGIDIYGKKMLPDLLKELAKTPGLEWIRVMYAYPSSLDEKTLEVMASEPKICKYVDIPLQHSHPDVLEKMGRSKKDLDVRQTIERIKKYLPNAAIRSTFITGHPGETEKRFADLVEFVKEAKFYNLGVFAYSPEEGTVSARYKTRPSKIEAERRRDYLMSIQQEISHNLRRKLIGKKVKAVCEHVLDEEVESEGIVINFEGENTSASEAPAGTRAIGRTEFDAPDIDGLLYIISPEPPKPGEFFTARITQAYPYDLAGTVE